MKQIVWDIDNTKSISGRETAVFGSPQIIDAQTAKAVLFDGVKDGLIVEELPLAGAEKFTLEIIFRPDANGLPAQRFLHLQQESSENRILIEIRLPDDNNWYLDTYIKTGKGDLTLAEPANVHPAGQWYSAALIYDGEKMRHYVNGIEEMSGKLAFEALHQGKTSIGMRINQIHWFKGAVRRVRFTPAVLEAKTLLQPEYH